MRKKLSKLLLDLGMMLNLGLIFLGWLFLMTSRPVLNTLRRLVHDSALSMSAVMVLNFIGAIASVTIFHHWVGEKREVGTLAAPRRSPMPRHWANGGAATCVFWLVLSGFLVTNLYVSLRDYPSGFYRQSIKGVMRNIVHCRKLLESAMALEQSEWERALDLSGIPSEQFRSVAPQLKEGLALLREKPQLLLTWQTPKERGRYASMPYVLVMAREPAIDRRRLLLAVNPQDGRIVLALSFCNDLPFLEALEMAEGE